MILILEIILTVKAWNKGWKGWALLPAAICFGVAYMTGYAIGASGGTIENPMTFIVFDIFFIITQIVLISKPRKTQVSSIVEPQIYAEKA